MMNYPCAYLGVVASLGLVGCSIQNPLFGVSSASDASDAGSGGAESTSVTPTSDPLTSTTRPETGESESTQAVTSVDPETGGTSSSGGEPGTTSDSDSGAVGCSNGIIDADLEKCDDGNQIDGDDCTNMCTLPKCGDGVLHDEEECDDGNNIPDDGCAADCTQELATCGNGDLDGNEQCDDGNQIDGDDCTNLCQLPACGDGVVQEGEQCDDGADNGENKACLGNCELNICGDGDQGPNEACDSGLANGTLPGKCNEECSALISFEMLKIKVQTVNNVPILATGHFNNNPGIAGGDALCFKNFGFGYKVLASDGEDGSRVASNTPFMGDGQKDWVLFAHRAYANAEGDLVFITGKEALLGVRKHVAVPLLTPIHGENQLMWTGLNKSWTSSEANCTGWTTKEGVVNGTFGVSSQKDGTFISSGTKACSNLLAIYCVQQPL